MTIVNGAQLRELEQRKRTAEITMERTKAESTRILEMIKTGNTEKAADNLKFLLQAGLLSDPGLMEKLDKFLKNRSPGTGPSLPAANGRIGFEASESLSQPLHATLQALLNRYFSYLDKTGFPKPKQRVMVRVQEHAAGLAHYDEANHTVVIDKRVADDPSVPLQSYNHYILNHPGSPQEGHYAAIRRGLADYFACSFLNNPHLGEKSAPILTPGKPYFQSLVNERTYADLRGPWPEAKSYIGTEVWGGFFWKLRARLGAPLADSTLASAWMGFSVPGKDSKIPGQFIRALLDELRSKRASPKNIDDVKALLANSGFPDVEEQAAVTPAH
ncbi:hypothetical protein OU994_17530 [Pseudoduganella sp. SL102]|uniref:hypothetical protein n=1 Tax=Pseudoduganella sp. SL102 TaxID=2995154 RepID=UPI00248BACFC|nr:hypothetical protein [Pseudoduganella sp. SL102]WBS00125.1 hypothetical protein OU994_17530 [Pseudoduganella sp. SL102]